MRSATKGLVAVATSALLASGGLFFSGQLSSGKGPDATKTEPKLAEAYGDLPLSFEPNRGQTDDKVNFLARGGGYTLFLTDDGATLSLQKPEAPSFTPDAPSQATVKMKLVGAGPPLSVTGKNRLEGKANYLVGSDPKGWQTNVPTFGKVAYKGVYPGIDMVYYGKQGQLEYDFVVAPGVDPSGIKLAFEGAQGLSIDRKGDLVITTGAGQVRQAKPVLYQDIGGERRSVAGQWVLQGPRQAGFQIGRYDATKTLVIDPTLTYSTWLGGGGADVGFGIAVDPDGKVVVAGQTASSNFPTSGSVTGCSGTYTTSSYQCNQPGTDAFVSKLNAAGSALEWSTYLGGSREDIAYRVALGSDNSVYVTGMTNSADDPGTTAVESGFPVTALTAFDATCGTDGFCNADLPADPTSCPTGGCRTVGPSDAFLTRLNSSGSSLVYSTYLGGADYEMEPVLTALPSHFGIAVSGTKAYVAGPTGSTDYPTSLSAYDSSCGSCSSGLADGFLTVLDTNQSGALSLKYSTYLGGSGADQPKSVAVDEDGDAFVGGITFGVESGSSYTNDFPTKSGSYDTSYNGGRSDGFLVKVDPDLSGSSSLVYSSFLGGGGKDEIWGIAVKDGPSETEGVAFVTGFTDSGDDPSTTAADGPTPYFPTTTGAYDTTFNGRATQTDGSTEFLRGDAFVAKFTHDGGGLSYSTLLGGTDGDTGGAVAVDSDGNAYVTGYTTCQNDNGGTPLPSGSTPPAACSGSFPMVSAIYSSMDGSYIGHELHNSPTDVFVAKLNDSGSSITWSTYLGGNDFERGYAIAVRDKDAEGDPITPEAYVTGRMAGTNYPTTTGAFITTKPSGKGNRDAAVSKITS